MELIPVFQPIVDIRKQYSKQVRYPVAEVLARWCGEGQVFGPNQVPIAVDWIKTDLEMATRIRHNLDACRLFFAEVSLNVSEETLSSDIAFKRWLDVMLSMTSKRTMKVIVEITEGVSDPVLKKRWPALLRLGAAIALDDYGDARSTFDRLTAREWDYCKFSAKRLMRSDGLDAVRLCSITGIRGIVEQVEGYNHSLFSQGLGLTLQQGYYHARPSFLSQFLNHPTTKSSPPNKENTNVYPKAPISANS